MAIEVFGLGENEPIIHGQSVLEELTLRRATEHAENYEVLSILGLSEAEFEQLRNLWNRMQFYSAPGVSWHTKTPHNDVKGGISIFKTAPGIEAPWTTNAKRYCRAYLEALSQHESAWVFKEELAQAWAKLDGDLPRVPPRLLSTEDFEADISPIKECNHHAIVDAYEIASKRARNEGWLKPLPKSKAIAVHIIWFSQYHCAPQTMTSKTSRNRLKRVIKKRGELDQDIRDIELSHSPAHRALAGSPPDHGA